MGDDKRRETNVWFLNLLYQHIFLNLDLPVFIFIDFVGFL